VGCVVGCGVLVSNDRPEEGLRRTCVGMTGGAGVEGIGAGGIGAGGIGAGGIGVVVFC